MKSELIDSCQTALDTLDSGLATQDQLRQAMELVRMLGEVHREMREHVEAAAVKFIEAHGAFEDGPKRYYVGTNKTTKCLNVRATIEAILQASGGDFDVLVDCLSSNALKHGASRKVLGDQTKKFFETSEVADLKTGEAKPRLQVADGRFQ